MLTDYFNDYASRYQPYKKGAWCYEDGCIYQGLRLLYEASGDTRWLDHLTRLVDGMVDGEGVIAGYDPTEYNIDNLLPGRALVFLSRVTGEPRYLVAAHRLAEQVAGHPRTRSGNFWHKQIYPEQVWLDGLYMGLPFAIEYGQATGKDAVVEDALAQLTQALRLTERDGLYVHGYDAARIQRWADPATGHSPTFWARALGWLAMALVDIIDDVGQARAGEELIARTADLLARIESLTTPSGLWLQVIDQPDLPGNYLESSASAMFAYALMKAARLGLRPATPTGAKALEALWQHRLRPDETGQLRLEGICQMAGLGGFGAVYRDGSPAYYLSEAVVADDAKGVGPLMMAASEHMRSPAPTA